MHVKDAKRATHADHSAEMHKDAFEPAGTLEAAVNKQAMQSDGMTDAKRGDCEDKRQEDSIVAKGKVATDDGNECVRHEPKRLHGCPHDAALDGIRALALAQHSWDFVSVHFVTG